MTQEILQQSVVLEENVLGVKNNCVHHEIIDPPRGEYSKAACTKCGATKVYANFLHFTFDDLNSTGQVSSLGDTYRKNGRFTRKDTLDYDPDSEYFD